MFYQMLSSKFERVQHLIIERTPTRKSAKYYKSPLTQHMNPLNSKLFIYPEEF